ncbi:MAG: DUF4145 domain-containing protein [Acidobacteriota bacterium]
MSNFSFLARHDPLLAEVGLLAERYALDDPNTALIKLRQLAELLAQRAAALLGLAVADADHDDSELYDLIVALERSGAIDRRVASAFHRLRITGNEAAHEPGEDTVSEAVHHLRIAREVAIWFERTFGDPTFRPGGFTKPRKLAGAEARLKEELAAVHATARRRRKEDEERLRVEQAARAAAERARDAASAERDVALELAAEIEARMAHATAERDRLRRDAAEASTARLTRAGAEAALRFALDEAETRLLIDQQLRDAGWLTDSRRTTWERGARPTTGTCRAIADVPAGEHHADYVLFDGTRPVAVIEAKRRMDDLREALGEVVVRRDAVAREIDAEIPFVLASNSRPYAEAWSHLSGVWLDDVRDDEPPRALADWPTPDALRRSL